MKRLAITLTVLVLVGVPLTALADTIFVKAKSGDVKAEPRGSSPTLAKADFGAQLDSSQKKGQWYAVSYQGNTGWIYGGSVSATKPDDDPSLTTKDGSKLSGSDVDAGSAVRGVGPTAEKYAGSNAIQPIHKKYLDYHQSFRSVDTAPAASPVTEPGIDVVFIKKEDVEAFMKEGKIGPYAE